MRGVSEHHSFINGGLQAIRLTLDDKPLLRVRPGITARRDPSKGGVPTFIDGYEDLLNNLDAGINCVFGIAG
jgi:hypothetical protein